MTPPPWLTAGVDDAGCVVWLEGALEYACQHGEIKLLAYLEAVMDEVLFEEELNATLPPALVD